MSADLGSRPYPPPLVLSYRIPASSARSEIVVKHSTFIGAVARAAEPDAARRAVEDARALHRDAHHHAWAYRGPVRTGPDIASSDDGEPGGTAGRPMLSVLEGSGLCEIVAVGTRYFGGTKLGTGGLVRAYSQCVREALRQVLVQEMLWHRVARLAIAYEQYGAAERLLKGNRVRIDAVEFADHVTLTVAVPHDHTAQVAIGLADLTGGRVSLDICWIGERYDAADQTSQ